jgi:NADH-quinone oxidoreductase subunit A
MYPLVAYALLFLLVGIGFILVHLLIGKTIRPARMDAEKATVYECGEPTVGSAWVQFDLRYYVVALLFVIFDVEVAFFFPWAVVFGQTNTIAQARPDQPEEQSDQLRLAKQELLGVPEDQVGVTAVTAAQVDEAKLFAQLAFLDILVFFGVLLVGFAYLWKRGDLAWVKSTVAERLAEERSEPSPTEATEKVLVGAGGKSI